MCDSKVMTRVLVAASVGLLLGGRVDVARGQCEANGLAKLLASGGVAGEFFGLSVAICGDTAVVGAIRHDSISGAAYVFERDGTVWEQVAMLTASDGEPGAEFGNSVACCGDTIVIGAYHDNNGNGTNAGSAYVFEKPPSGWADKTEDHILLPPGVEGGDDYGASVAICGDTIVVGAAQDDDLATWAGAAYVFQRDGSGWILQAKLHASDGAIYNYQFGRSVACSGDTIVIGARDGIGFTPGAAYVFEKPPGGWVDTTEDAKLTSSDGQNGDDFGDPVDIDGDTIVVGATSDRDNGSLSGSAYVFVKPGASWVDMTETTKLLPSDGAGNDRFFRAAIDGDIIVVGAQYENGGTGSAYVFMKPPGGWGSVPSPLNEDAKLLASDGEGGDSFGAFAAISGDTALIGAFQDDNHAGSAYVFGGLSDCNANDTLDICDIVDGPSDDENGNGIPDECEHRISLDIKPGSCPNPLNRSSHGVLPVAVVGTGGFDVMEIDISSLRLSRADGIGGQVAPNEGPPGPHTVIADVATPIEGQACDCHDQTGDGIDDMSMKFRTDEVVEILELADFNPGDEVELVVTALLLDGTGFTTEGDCILIVPQGTSNAGVQSNVSGTFIEIDPPDINVDASGFANFGRIYNPGTVITLTAPEQVDGLSFHAWLVNGVMRNVGETATEVTVVGDLTAFAVYRYWRVRPTIGPRLTPTSPRRR